MPAHGPDLSELITNFVTPPAHSNVSSIAVPFEDGHPELDRFAGVRRNGVGRRAQNVGDPHPGTLADAMQCMYDHARVFSSADTSFVGNYWDGTCHAINTSPISIGLGATNLEGNSVGCGISNESSPLDITGPGTAGVRVDYCRLMFGVAPGDVSSPLVWPRTPPPFVLDPVLVTDDPITSIPAVAARMVFKVNSVTAGGSPTFNFFASKMSDWLVGSFLNAAEFGGTGTPAPFGTLVGSLSAAGSTFALDMSSLIDPASEGIVVEVWTDEMISPIFPSSLLSSSFAAISGNVTAFSEVDYLVNYHWEYGRTPLRCRQRQAGNTGGGTPLRARVNVPYGLRGRQESNR